MRLSPGSGGPWAEEAPSPSYKQAMALLHSAAPNRHVLEPNWLLPGTGAAWAWCLPPVLAGRAGVFYPAVDVAEHHEHRSLKGNSSRQGSDKDQVFKNMFMA